MTDKNYVTYHLHSEVSLLDSCTNYKDYIDMAVQLGQKAICFTEHGNTFNWIEKKMYANSKGLKFLYGCEVYLTETLDEKIRDNYHTILIAKNYKGLQELNTLIDLSTQDNHTYYKNRLSFDEFLGISDNIIKISACIQSPLCKYPKSETASSEVYERLLKKYDYYEIQYHSFEEQIHYNNMLYLASKKYNKPLIAGTDTHSLNKYKAECRSMLQLSKGIEFSGEDECDLTYKSYDELVDAFRKQASLPMDIVLEAIENTNVMADSVEDFELDTSFKYPKIENGEEKLKKKINKSYKEKVARGEIKPDKRYKENVKEELRVFNKVGMTDFMLFMSDLIEWCLDNGIPVGFCRGSVGGSTIAYLSNIIDVDPIKWKTIFSRFCNESRVEIGDIDVDISPSQRHLVYEYIIEKYGSDKTAYILSTGTIADKGCIDDIARGLAKRYSREKNYELANKYSLDNTKKIKELYEIDERSARDKYKELFYYFDGMKGCVISKSMHPAGIVVSPVTLPDNYGTFWNEGKRILSINMEEVHEVSLVKYDILGLKNIEIIKDCCKYANIKYPKAYEIDWEDNNVWDHIVDSPVGIFQFESRFAYDSMKKMNCRTVNDLSLVNASIRPSGESYREQLLNREPYHNPSEIIDELLKDNHGYLVFQEDTIKFLQDICGLSGSEADNVRRAIGRKQEDRLMEAMPRILEGYCKMSDKPREVAEEEANAFMEIISNSVRYQFGYNHSTGYSMIGYLCGYLRYYYPVEFITAYLNNANNDDDINNGTELARQLSVNIVNIKFRHSNANYTCDSTKRTIYKGIQSIKFMNEKVANELYELRNNTYDNFILLLKDIKELTSLNSKQLDILIRLDFFSEFGDINYLLKCVDLFNNINGKKQFKKDKLFELSISEDIVKEFASKETEKMFTQVDTDGLLSRLCNNIMCEKTTIVDRLANEIELLGYCTSIDPTASPRLYMATKVEVLKSIVNIELYGVKNGDTQRVKVWRKSYDRDLSYVKDGTIGYLSVKKDNKKEWDGTINEATGKRNYVPVPNEYEFWLKGMELYKE